MNDAMFAWSCAANLVLYDADPGERRINLGSVLEPRIVDRRDALIDVYARQVLVHCDADPDRLDAAATECRRRERAAGTLAALTPQARREYDEGWAIAGELVAAALRKLTEAGGLEDRWARARLLASTNHSLTQDILGAFLPDDALHEAAADLATRLDEIDRTPNTGNERRGDEGRADGPQPP